MNKHEQGWIDSLAKQYGAKQAATLRGDSLGAKGAESWLRIIASEHWHEIIAALRKEQGNTCKPAAKVVKSLCWRQKDTGNLIWCKEGDAPLCYPVASLYVRFPVGDRTGEVSQ